MSHFSYGYNCLTHQTQSHSHLDYKEPVNPWNHCSHEYWNHFCAQSITLHTRLSTYLCELLLHFLHVMFILSLYICILYVCIATHKHNNNNNKNLFLYTCYKLSSKNSRSCSSADEDEEEEPVIKAQRERERRQANNARERYSHIICFIYIYICIHLIVFPTHMCLAFCYLKKNERKKEIAKVREQKKKEKEGGKPR